MKNFYRDPKFQAEMQHAAKEAAQHLSSIRPLANEQALEGASFLFTESLDVPVRWVAILVHRDDSRMWYLVAADDFARVGSCDVELPASSPFSPLVLRCGVGLWARYEDIEIDRFIGKLDTDSVADARIRLAEMANGNVPVTEHGRINDADDEYREWLGELSEIAERIERRIQSEPVVLSKVRFDTSWVDSVSLVADSRSNYAALAADSVGQQKDGETPVGLLLPSSLPGKLVLQREGDGFDLVYYPVGDDIPPCLAMVCGKSALSGKWIQGPDGVWTWSDILKAPGKHLSLVIGVEKFEIPVS